MQEKKENFMGHVIFVLIIDYQSSLLYNLYIMFQARNLKREI